MTLKPTHDYGKPPEYPTSSMVPEEFWRKQVDGDPDNKQVITIETPDGPVKKEVVRGWTKPVHFDSDEADD